MAYDGVLKELNKLFEKEKTYQMHEAYIEFKIQILQETILRITITFLDM